MGLFKSSISASLLLLLLCGVALADDIDQGDTRWFYRYIDQNTGGESFETYSWGDTWYLTHLGSGLEMIRAEENQSKVFITQGDLVIGDLGTTAGRLSLSGSALTLHSQGNLNLSANGVSYRWPTADGTSGQFIRTDAAGNLSFATGGGGITIGSTTITGGTDTRVLFNDGGVVGEDAGLTYVKGTDALTIVGPLSAGTSTLGDTTATSLTVDTLTTGVTLDTDGDGALSIQSASSGFAEEIRVNLDDTSNTAVWNSSTGVTSWVFTSMSLEATGAAPSFKLTPTSGDAHEWWVNGGIAGFANTTDGSQIWRTTTANAFQTIGKLITEGGAELNGAIDASAATSFSIPTATLLTMSANGQIGLEPYYDRLVVRGGSGRSGQIPAGTKIGIPLMRDIHIPIIDPDGVQTTQDTFEAFFVDPEIYPHGITLVKARVVFNAANSSAYVLEEWTNVGTPASSSTLLTMTMVSQIQKMFYSFADASVAAGNSIRVNLDSTALNMAHIYLRFYANTA